MYYRKPMVLMTALIFMLSTAATALATVGPERARLADEVEPWFTKGTDEMTKNHKVILTAGETSYCGTDFMLENLGEDLAQVQVIFGNGATYHWDRIAPKGMQRYKLQPGSEYAFPNAKGVAVEEARIVNSTTGNAHVMVHCTM